MDKYRSIFVDLVYFSCLFAVFIFESSVYIYYLYTYILVYYVFHKMILKTNISYEFHKFEIDCIIKLFRNNSTSWAYID